MHRLRVCQTACRQPSRVSFFCCQSKPDKHNEQKTPSSNDLSVYLRPAATHDCHGASNKQSYNTTLSIGHQPLEVKISVIQEAVQRGHCAVAATVADIAKAVHPNEARFFTLGAFVKMQLGDYAGAMPELCTSLTLQPHSTMANLLYAVCKFNQGQRSSAVSTMYNISETMQLDELVVDKNLSGDIIDFLRVLLEHNPGDARILQQRGYCKAATKDIEQVAAAVQDLTSAIKLGLTTPQSFHFRAKAYMVMLKWQEAISDLDRAHVMAPSDSAILADRAEAKSKFEDQSGAIADYNMLEQLHSLSIQQLVHRASLQQAVSNDDASRRDYLQAIECTCTCMADVIARAKAWFALGHVAAALDELNHADSLEPGQTAVLKQRGIVKFMLNDLEGFVQDLNGRTDDIFGC